MYTCCDAAGATISTGTQGRHFKSSFPESSILKLVSCSLRDEHCNCYFTCFDIGIFNRPRRIQTPPSLFYWFGGDKTIKTKFEPLPVFLPLLAQAVPEDNGQANGAVLWHSLADWTGKHIGCFQLGCSCCWPQQARLTKKCCHSCNT